MRWKTAAERWPDALKAGRIDVQIQYGCFTQAMCASLGKEGYSEWSQNKNNFWFISPRTLPWILSLPAGFLQPIHFTFQKMAADPAPSGQSLLGHLTMKNTMENDRDKNPPGWLTPAQSEDILSSPGLHLLSSPWNQQQTVFFSGIWSRENTYLRVRSVGFVFMMQWQPLKTFVGIADTWEIVSC